MKLSEEIKPYLEGGSGAVSLVPDRPGPSTDNGLLFSSVFMVLMKLTEPESVASWLPWYEGVIGARELSPGCYARFPESTDPSSWDDHHGVLCASTVFYTKHRLDIYKHFVSHLGFWGTNPLIRIPIFTGMILFGRFGYFTFMSRMLVRLAFGSNFFEPAGETSGKILLYLAYRACIGFDASVDKTIYQWREKMQQTYGRDNWLYEVFKIYYSEEHPFTRVAYEYGSCIG